MAASCGSVFFYNSAFAFSKRSLPRSRGFDLAKLDKGSEGLGVFLSKAIMPEEGINMDIGRQNSARPEFALPEERTESFPVFPAESRSVILDRLLVLPRSIVSDQRPSKDADSSRRPTMTDLLVQRGEHRMSAEGQERNRGQTIREFIIRCPQEVAPAFVRFVVDGFAKAHCTNTEEERHAALERM
jgi:hypothetical protein